MSTAAFGQSNIYDFAMNSIEGKPMPLADFKGKVLLLVNVASRCGYTPQYDGLGSVVREVQSARPGGARFSSQ